MSKPSLTQQMTIHMNGGSKFSELHYQIYADGVPTRIRRCKQTNGRPEYLITVDVFSCGDDQFDNLAARGDGLEEWLLAHLEEPIAQEGGMP